MSDDDTPAAASGSNDEPNVVTKPAPKKPTPRKKAGAARPAGAKAGKGKGKADDRRFFMFLFTAVAIGWAAFVLACVAMLLGMARFMFPNVLAEPPSQFKVGPPDQFDPGLVDTRWKDEFQVWIVNLADEKRIIALSTVCTHLGCTPSWLDTDQKFKCPCHGSGFYKNGINFEGPAPRPLERFRIFEVDGVVSVDKSKKFQFELGQWDEPESFLSA